MLIIPAIDLKDGNVVRLYQGKDDEKVYSRNPVVVARHWKKQGASMIHVVDLDGAFTGEPRNLSALKKIVQAVDTPIEFGGGLRTKDIIRSVFALGVKRVVLGTKAVEDLDFLREVYDEFGQGIIVTIDAKNGIVLTQGWQESSSGKKTAVDFALELKKMGFPEVIYTDTSKDGTLRGPNIPALEELLTKTGLGVIASGGVSNIDDVFALAKLGSKGLTGVIVGKALYEERFMLKEALNLLKTHKEEGI
ncbi:MAG: 1-(5-phosphoribosyl)-5-[(5-phosphoribosylamino)methylideneamino]imidazole-4-carboxamide isomerase [Candidatus Omnitrophota bacterium]